jgi:hypothetical protein
MSRELEAIGDGLSTWLKRLGLADADLFFTLVAAWQGAVGEPWQSGAEPVMLAEGELTVRVHNRASIRVLSYGVTDLIDRLNEAVQQPAVESVRLVGPAASA